MPILLDKMTKKYCSRFS